MERVSLECMCDKCQKSCDHKPGWFKFGEAEKAAELKGMTLQEFFNKYLSVDFFVGDTDDENIYVLSPASRNSVPGKEFSFMPLGKCIFFEDGLCSIHMEKPHECRITHHDLPTDENHSHEEAMDSWNTPEGRAQLEQLLGRKPEVHTSTSAITMALNTSHPYDVATFLIDVWQKDIFHAMWLSDLLSPQQRVRARTAAEQIRDEPSSEEE